MQLTKKQRELLFARFDGRCAYCGCELGRGWHADHVEPIGRDWTFPQAMKRWKESVARFDRRGLGPEAAGKMPIDRGCDFPERDCWENLMPACRPCNIDKHANTLEGWRGMLGDRVRVLRDNYSAFRHAERFGLVLATNQPVVFHFEKVSQ